MYLLSLYTLKHTNCHTTTRIKHLEKLVLQSLRTLSLSLYLCVQKTKIATNACP